MGEIDIPLSPSLLEWLLFRLKVVGSLDFG
jgi:hypothetical protein